MGERLPCKQEVGGSNPLISTRKQGFPLGSVREIHQAITVTGTPSRYYHHFLQGSIRGRVPAGLKV